MSEATEISSAPITPRPGRVAPVPPPISCPPSQYHSPSLSKAPLLNSTDHIEAPPAPSKTPRTPKISTPRTSLTPRFITPLGSPVRKALRLTKLDPQDAWLPITESRNGNAYYAAFHTLCSGIGVQALILPVAFTILGWTWGIIGLTVAFVWQLYTLWVLVHLHESGETGMRYSRYIQLFSATFAGVPLIGAITAIGYCTSIWVVSVAEGRLPGVSYDPVGANTDIATVFGVLNALGIIAFAFRGHNLILEIQATMPSSEKHPSHVPMWRGVKFAYLVIATCIFPLAIGGYWAYGHMIPANGGMLTALYQFHSRDVSRFALGLTSLFVIINAVSSFQIYGMPMFDDMESKYTVRNKQPCPWWLRSLFRFMFGYGCFFVAVAIPFLGSLAGLIGGIALPVTLAYPCFMWLKIKKPKMYSGMWWLN
ncbi:hypothetical protein L1049_001771 [Liquidambar formosana]|uniref:Amino acid transporter transmembrane domain-containing protein n=1 Tax=Liquidambar formosana TaxID=63359 RepID=A0AAP0N3S7_LIQFO